ncbi:MAG: GAP family protein [Thermoleophilaceae bacterium]|nr:GAP family protein [Thermoleophilaceae bacterium]
MLQLLAFVVPLGLAGAISPVLLTEQTVVLAGPNGTRIARFFAAGAMIALFAFVCALVLFGRAIELPKTPHLSATLDVVIGVALLGLAAFLRVRRPKPKTEKSPRGELNARAAYIFGTVSMATNFTTLALIIPASKEIAASHVDFAERVIVAVILVVLASIPVWLPLALTAIAPGPALRGLNAFGDFIQRRGHAATITLVAIIGIVLLVRGVLRLV